MSDNFMNLKNIQPEVDASIQSEIPEQINNPANWMTFGRLIAAPFIGWCAAKGYDITGPAMVIASMSDGEGNVARWGARRGYGWLTEIGRKFDPIADKVLAVSVGLGTFMAGLGNSGETALTGSILAEQIAIAGISMAAEKRHPGELHVSKIGKAGIALVFGYLTGKNMLNFTPVEQNAGAHDVISATTTSLGIGSIGVVGLAMKGYVKSAFHFGRKNNNPIE